MMNPPLDDEAASAAEVDPPRPPPFTDEALALHFADLHERDMRFVAAWGQWLYFDGKRWAEDQTKLAFSMAREVCREASAQCNEHRVAVGIASAKTVAAVERLARADRRLAATTEQWDREPLLLNTPAGVVDLQTGQMRGHRHDDYFTKITASAPSGDCPIWRTFLDRVTGGDVALQEYLKRQCGYALTGSVREHTMAFLYGQGANGKSVFLSTFAGLLGDYHKTAPIETFTASNTDRHPTELAGLRGARLVTAIETEEGRRWAESRIKSLTGGDRVAARFMRQDFFEYTPQFKLIIAGNHKPGLRAVDEAIRRRLHLVPFTVTIPSAERDLDLAEKLKAEWNGILAWAIEGCLDWQREGLKPPEAVLDATAAYLEAEDAVSAWIEETCDRDPDAWTQSTDLYRSWRTWTENAGEHVGSQKQFSQNLEARGFTNQRNNRGRGFLGLSLRNKNHATTKEAQ